MLKFIFKWLFRLFILAVVLLIVAALSIDPILRVVIQNRIRAETGMDAEIGKFSLGLVSPTITIRDLKLYNPPDYGGTLFLDIPEIHVEYDRAALAQRKIHVTLMRFDLSELDIVKNEAGQTNVFSLGVTVPTKTTGSPPKINFKKETGYDFAGIDVLNLSIGKAQYIDLHDSQNNRSQTIGISNCIIKNVKSETDLIGLAPLIVLKSDGFFNFLVKPQRSGSDILKSLGW